MANTLQERFAGKTIVVTLRRPNAEVINLLGDRFTGTYDGSNDVGIYLRRQERVMLIHWNAVETIEEVPRLPDEQ